MKITDIVIRREELADGQGGLTCIATLADGSLLGSGVVWRSRLGLWASDSDERDPAEIAAHLRNFARAIEDAAKEKSAA